MTDTLIIIILICGFIALVQAVNSLSHSPGTLIPVTIILAVFYTLLVGGMWYVYIAFGRNMMVVYGGLAFVVLIMSVLFVKFFIKHRYSMSTSYTIWFVVYFGVVLYLTLFSRAFGSDSSVRDEAFRGLELAIKTQSFEPMIHSMLNLVLFLPFGYLIPNMNRDYLSRWGFAVIGGVVTSSVIEGIQLVAQMGQCDIDDIIFNSIGAAIGYVFYRFARQVEKNWRFTK